MRSGHEPASTDTILTTFLAKSRKRTGVKEEKTMYTLRNNIWHSGRTSENLLPGKMMFSQIQCCSPPELSAKHPSVRFGIHILKQKEAIERSTRNNTSTICIFKATLFTMTMPLSFTRQGDFYLQMIVLRKKFTVSSFFSLIGDQTLSKSFNMPWL